jgi:GNAT superfamily N-acetyltransferase
VRAQHIKIRKATARDLDGLVRVLGQRTFFVDRLHRQQVGRGELITAWSDEQALGAVYLWLERADEAEIRSHLPGVPLLTHLEVAEPHRNGQIGTLLVKATERTTRELRYDQLALAVDLENSGAERLYRRLGYADWAHGRVRCRDEFEGRTEICNVFVKNLTVWEQLLPIGGHVLAA